jgi:hypothetical protein
MEKYITSMEMKDVVISEEDLNWLYNDTDEELVMSALTENIGINKLKYYISLTNIPLAQSLYITHLMIIGKFSFFMNSSSSKQLINEHISSVQKEKIKKIVEKYGLEEIYNENSNIENKVVNLKCGIMKACLQHYNVKPFDININPKIDLTKIKNPKKLKAINNKINNRNDVFNLYSKTIEDFGYKFESNEFKEVLDSIK